MGVWVNWGLVVAAIGFLFGDLVLEAYAGANLAVLGLLMLGGGILGLAADSAVAGVAVAVVLVLGYMGINRRPGQLLPKRVSGQ